MSFRKAFLLLSVFVGFAAGALTGFGPVSAQQAEPKSATPRPTPPPDEDEEVLRIETEAVNILFTAQDKNRRLLTNLKPGECPQWVGSGRCRLRGICGDYILCHWTKMKKSPKASSVPVVRRPTSSTNAIGIVAG